MAWKSVFTKKPMSVYTVDKNKKIELLFDAVYIKRKTYVNNPEGINLDQEFYCTKAISDCTKYYILPGTSIDRQYIRSSFKYLNLKKSINDAELIIYDDNTIKDIYYKKVYSDSFNYALHFHYELESNDKICIFKDQDTVDFGYNDYMKKYYHNGCTYNHSNSSKIRFSAYHYEQELKEYPCGNSYDHLSFYEPSTDLSPYKGKLINVTNFLNNAKNTNEFEELTPDFINSLCQQASCGDEQTNLLAINTIFNYPREYDVIKFLLLQIVNSKKILYLSKVKNLYVSYNFTKYTGIKEFLKLTTPKVKKYVNILINNTNFVKKVLPNYIPGIKYTLELE